jgi:hypothetical protein
LETIIEEEEPEQMTVLVAAEEVRGQSRARFPMSFTALGDGHSAQKLPLAGPAAVAGPKEAVQAVDLQPMQPALRSAVQETVKHIATMQRSIQKWRADLENALSASLEVAALAVAPSSLQALRDSAPLMYLNQDTRDLSRCVAFSRRVQAEADELWVPRRVMGLDSHATVAVATMEMVREWGIQDLLEPTTLQLQVAGGVASVVGTVVLCIHYGPGQPNSFTREMRVHVIESFGRLGIDVLLPNTAAEVDGALMQQEARVLSLAPREFRRSPDDLTPSIYLPLCTREELASVVPAAWVLREGPTVLVLQQSHGYIPPQVLQSSRDCPPQQSSAARPGLFTAGPGLLCAAGPEPIATGSGLSASG